MGKDKRHINPAIKWVWDNYFMVDTSPTSPVSSLKKKLSIFLWGWYDTRLAMRCWADLITRSYTPWLREYWIGLFWDLL